MASNFGMQIRKNGRLAVSPDFAPLTLVQVADIPANTSVFKTVVPNGKSCLVFHRGLSAMDEVYFQQTVTDGYVSLTFPAEIHRASMTRVYIFSNLVPPAPGYGFYIYSGGQIIYHSSCLPLKMNTMDGYNTITSSKPLAVNACITGLSVYNPSGETYYCNWLRTSAGPSGSSFAINSGRDYSEFMVKVEDATITAPAEWHVDRVGYIETDVYDTYFKQSLGY